MSSDNNIFEIIKNRFFLANYLLQKHRIEHPNNKNKEFKLIQIFQKRSMNFINNNNFSLKKYFSILDRSLRRAYKYFNII